MALTEAKIKNLTDKKFDTLYTENKAKWTKLAKHAYDYAKAHITAGKPPRPDDVEGPLHAVLEVDDDLRAHQEDEHARASRYVTMFTEYVIDQSLFSGGSDGKTQNH